MTIGGDGWHFERMPPSRVRADPFQKEFFVQQEHIDSLVREAIQNSLDQALTNEKVVVRIRLSGDRYALTPDQAAPYLAGLTEHLSSVEGIVLPPADARMPFLVVEDFGTTGLTGNPEEVDGAGAGNHFFWFWRNEGRTGKTSGKRGSRGVGKWVFPGSSKLKAFFAYTVPADSRSAFLMGKAVLAVHQLQGATYDWYGFFGSLREDGLQLPVASQPTVARFLRDFKILRTEAPGLSIVVPYPDEDIDETKLIEVIGRNYFLPIIRGDLVVEIQNIERKIRFSHETLFDLVSGEVRAISELTRWTLSLPDDAFVTIDANQLSWTAISEDSLSEIRQSFAASGRVAVRVKLMVERKDVAPQQSFFDAFLERSFEGDPGGEYYIREGITIPDATGNRAGRRLRAMQGLLVVADGPLAGLMRDSEGPAHRTWVASEERVTEHYRNGRQMVHFVAQALRQLGEVLSEKPEGRAYDLLAVVPTSVIYRREAGGRLPIPVWGRAKL